MVKVITYGTYDLLHYGHIRLLQRAKALGDYLIVGITSDDYDKTRGKINNQQSLMERIEALGLRLRVSELDITIQANNEASLRSQAIRYENLFGLFIEHAASLDAVQLWGVSDDLSWLAPQYPLLFDARMQPKPAFWSVVELAAQ